MSGILERGKNFIVGKRVHTSAHETRPEEVKVMGNTHTDMQADVKAIQELAGSAGIQVSDEMVQALLVAARMSTPQETATLEVESTSVPEGTWTPREGEVVFGITRVEYITGGIKFPAGSRVSEYKSADGKSYKRAWAYNHTGKYVSRLLPKEAWANKGIVKRVSTPSKQFDRETRTSAAQAQVKAVNEYNGTRVMYAKGSKITRTANGKPQAHAKVDGKDKPTFVSESQVKNGKLVEDVTRTYYSQGLTNKVKRHMSGKCTCSPTWPCPAVQIIGPNDARIGEHDYTLAGKKDAPFEVANISRIDLSGRSASKYLAKHLDVWGLDS